MERLSSKAIQMKLGRLDGWSLENNELKKDFEFATFLDAMAFMNRLAPVAEKLNHHPDWSNSYNKVSISLTSHEAHGLTESDFILAHAADNAAQPSES